MNVHSLRHLATWILASLFFFFGTAAYSPCMVTLSPKPKAIAIQIIAAGVTNEEIIELEIDGTVVAVFENVGGDAYAGQFVTLDYNDPQLESVNNLRINFTNDFYDGNIDRNVRIDAVIVDGLRFETEDPTVYSVGSWTEFDGCAPGFKQSEFLNCNGFFEFQLGTALNPIAGSFGDIAFTHVRTTVQFQTSITNPVIVASVPTFNEEQPGTLGIDNVDNAGFDIRFREWEYLNQTHAAEDAEWLALEQGVYLTADGSVWEVGTFVVSDNNNFVSKAFTHDFGATPKVFTTLQSANGPPVAVRIRNVTVDGFEAALFEEESRLASAHPQETVGYLAILPSANSGIVTIDNQVFPYLFEEFRFGQNARANERRRIIFDEFPDDYSSVAINSRLSLILQEEKSFDSEVYHVREDFSVMTLGSKVYAQDQTFRGRDPFTLRSIRRETSISLPVGFEFAEVLGAEAFEDAVAMAIDQQGRIFVAEESGIIWIVENGVKSPLPYLDISSKVANEFADNGGFSGFALDPEFSDNGLFYVMYTTEEQGQEFGRVERYQQSASDRSFADPNSSFVLIGNNVNDGLRKGTFHNVGDMEFGFDGSLLLSWGDTASNDPDDPDQFLSQDINAAAGKILRIDPATGLGYSSNPFFTGNLNDFASKVWALGLRNGFRIELVPGSGNFGDPGTLIITDVGRHDFEEIDLVSGGENLGWPFFEANQRFRLGGDGLALTFPAFALPHPGARSVIGGAFYEGTQWPASYNGQFFVSDFVEGWLRSYIVEPDGTITESDFGLEVKGMTDMKFDPSSGKMYLIGRGRDIIFGAGEGLDGLYSITFVGP